MIKIVIAFILDQIFADPISIPHPVVYIGKLISNLEKKLLVESDKKRTKKIKGYLLTFMVVSITFTFFSSISFIAGKINPILKWIVDVYFMYTAIATKCLKQEALKVYEEIKSKNIENARTKLSYIVGRDTKNLDFNQITKAVIETVAENTVDGVTAVLFYAAIGSMPLAMAYKAINTLDSMVGYKNDKYEDFGFASAKLDDIANFIPARLTSILMIISTIFTKTNFRNSIKICIRDRKNHKSPNCAYPESVVAGALGIKLGGSHYYFNKQVYKPTIGDEINQINEEQIKKSIEIMFFTSCLSLLVIFLIGSFLNV